MTTRKQALLDVAIKAVIVADTSTRELGALVAHVETLQADTVSAVEVACAESYKASVAGVSGADIARGAKVSEMTVSRYIAGGKVALQTDGKVSGSKVVSDIGNGYISVKDAKNVENKAQYDKAVSKGKADKRDNKGNGSGAKRTPFEVAKAHLESVAKAIESGKVSLPEVLAIWQELLGNVEDTELDEMELELDEELELV